MSKAIWARLARLARRRCPPLSMSPSRQGGPMPPHHSLTAQLPDRAMQCQLRLPGGAEAPRLASFLQTADEQTRCMFPSQ